MPDKDIASLVRGYITRPQELEPEEQAGISGLVSSFVEEKQIPTVTPALDVSQEAGSWLPGLTQTQDFTDSTPRGALQVSQTPSPAPLSPAATTPRPPSARGSIKSQAQAGWEEGQLQLDEGMTGWNWMMGKLPEEEAKRQRGQYLQQMVELQKTAPEWDWGSLESMAQSMVRGTAKLAPYMGWTIAESQKYGLATGMGFGGTAAIAGQLGPQIATPEEIVTVPGATAAGYAVGTTYGSIKSAMEIEGGSIYAKLRDEGIEHGTAKTAALAAGSLIGVIEVSQVGRVLKHLPGGKYFSKQAVTKAVMNNPKLMARLSKIGLEFTKDISIEVVQEITQELVTLGGEVLSHIANAAVKEVKYGGPTVKEAINRVYETGTEMLKGIPGILLPGKAVQVGKAIKGGPVQAEVVAEGKGAPGAAPQTRAVSVEPPSRDQEMLQRSVDEANKRIAVREVVARIAALEKKKREAKLPIPAPETPLQGQVPLSPEIRDMVGVKGEKPVLPEGWTEGSPGSIATSKDPARGGIVDQQIATGKWFVIPNDDALAKIPLEGYESREEAMAALDTALKWKEKQAAPPEKETPPPIPTGKPGEVSGEIVTPGAKPMPPDITEGSRRAEEGVKYVKTTDTLYKKGGVRPPDYPVGTLRKNSDGLIDELIDVPLDELTYTDGNKIYLQRVGEYKKAQGLSPQLMIKDGKYVIDDGHHRIEAAKQNGERSIKAWVRQTPVTPTGIPTEGSRRLEPWEMTREEYAIARLERMRGRSESPENMRAESKIAEKLHRDEITYAVNSGKPIPAHVQADYPDLFPKGEAAAGGPKKGEIGMKLEEGESVLTATGRETTPFPKVDISSEIKAKNTVKRVDSWLIQNALDEARARGDEYNARMFKSNLKKPSQADKDLAEEYLFGGEAETQPAPEPPPEPKAKPEPVKAKAPAKKPTTVKPERVVQPDQTVKAVMPSGKALSPVLKAFQVKDGKMQATDLELFLSIDTDRKPGVYEFVGKDAVPKDIPAEEFPTAPATTKKIGEVNRDEFIRNFRRMTRAASTDETRYVLNGVALDVKDGRGKMVATDGRRLAQSTIDVGKMEDGEYVISNPRQVEKVLHGITGEKLEVRLAEDKRFISFTGDNGSLAVRLIDGRFPDYSQVVPEKLAREVTVAGKDLDTALKDIAPYVKKSENDEIRMEVKGDKIKISSVPKPGGEKGAEKEITIPAKIGKEAVYPGDTGTIIMPMKGDDSSKSVIYINPSFLRDALPEIRDDQVAIGFTDGNSPIMVKGGELPKTKPEVKSVAKKGAKRAAKVEKKAPAEAGAVVTGPTKEPPAIRTPGAGATAAFPAAQEVTIGAKPMSKPPRQGKPAREAFKDVDLKDGGGALSAVLEITSPAHVGKHARTAAQIVRHRNAVTAQAAEARAAALGKVHRAFAFMGRDQILDFIDRMETGQKQDEIKLNRIADILRKALDERREAVKALGTGKLEHFYENYFPHIWTSPSEAKKFISSILAKRPMHGKKSFLKKRSIVTVRDGIEAGLEPVSWNPIDLVLFKTFEMDRYIMGEKVIADLKERGLLKFVYARSKPPEGYSPVKDPAFSVYMPPKITTKEAYDKLMVEQLEAIAQNLGIPHDRLMKLRGRDKWGYAYKSPEKIETRFAGPESVMVHEIGHILGFRYKLLEWITRKGDGEYKRITKGKNEGETRFVPSEDAVEARRTINQELRTLADARFEGQKATPAFQKYVRKGVEKEAVLLEALIHAPEEMQKIAPTVTKLFKQFLNDHAELRPLLDIKPSLVLGSKEGELAIPGATKLGDYYAPHEVATVLNNFLSPGIRNNQHQLISGGYNLLRGIGNVLNQANLSLSLFHLLNTATDSIASQFGLGLRQVLATRPGFETIKGAMNIATSPAAPITNLWRGNNAMKAWRTDLDRIESPELRQLIESVMMAGGRGKMDPYYHNNAIQSLLRTVSDIVRGTPGQKVKAVGKMPFNIAGATLQVVAKPVMEWWVPRQKFGLFALMVKHEMARLGTTDLSDERLRLALSKAWDSVDNRMGQLVYDNLFWHKTLKDGLMLAVRSVGWNLGSWREYAGAVLDLPRTVQRVRDGDAWISHKMGYSIGAVILYAVLGAVIMKALTGQGPEELKDYFFPKTGFKNPDGSDERISLPTYAKDWFAYSIQFTRTIGNKLHPLWNFTVNAWNNEDYYGTKIRNEDDPLVRQVKDFAQFTGESFLPFSVRNFKRMMQAGGTPLRAAAVSATGITSAPSYITQSPAQKLMRRYISDKMPRGSRTREEAERGQLIFKLAESIRAKKSVDREEWNSLTKKDQKKVMDRAKTTSFAASFKKLSFTEALNVYAVSSTSERRQVHKILFEKKGRYGREKSDYLEAMQLYNELVR